MDDYPIICGHCGKEWDRGIPGCSWSCWAYRHEGCLFVVGAAAFMGFFWWISGFIG